MLFLFLQLFTTIIVCCYKIVISWARRSWLSGKEHIAKMEEWDVRPRRVGQPAGLLQKSPPELSGLWAAAWAEVLSAEGRWSATWVLEFPNVPKSLMQVPVCLHILHCLSVFSNALQAYIVTCMYWHSTVSKLSLNRNLYSSSALPKLQLSSQRVAVTLLVSLQCKQDAAVLLSHTILKLEGVWQCSYELRFLETT